MTNFANFWSKISHAALGVAFIGALSSAAHAQVPVMDMQTENNTQQILQKVTQHLTLLQQIQQLTQQIKAATGNAGAGANGIQNLMSGSGLSGGSQMLSGLSGMSSGIIGQAMSAAQSGSGGSGGASPSSAYTAGLGSLQSVMNGTVTGSNAIQTLNGALYVGASTAPTAQQVEAVNDLRRLNLQNAALTALSTALQVQNQVGTNGSSQFSSLSQGSTQTQDLRSDIAANTTGMMKILEQTVAQNALLSAGLNLQAAQQIANDGVNGQAGGNQNGTSPTSTSSASSNSSSPSSGAGTPASSSSANSTGTAGGSNTGTPSTNAPAATTLQ